MACGYTRGYGPAAGFTLIGLIVVMAILSLLFWHLTSFRLPGSRKLELRAIAEERAAGLRASRSEAIAQNRAVTFDVYLDAGIFKTSAAPPQKIAAGLTIQLPTIAGERLGLKRAGIRFFPDGSSTGGRITIVEANARSVAVGVDWVSGRVRSPLSADRAANSAGGFMLLEVVIALAIASLALIALFRAGSDGILAVDVAARYEEAVQRAESHLSQLVGVADLSPGEAEGDDGKGYQWHTQIRPVTVQPRKGSGSGALTLLDVDVTISWNGLNRPRSVALHTRRLGTMSIGE